MQFAKQVLLLLLVASLVAACGGPSTNPDAIASSPPPAGSCGTFCSSLRRVGREVLVLPDGSGGYEFSCLTTPNMNPSDGKVSNGRWMVTLEYRDAEENGRHLQISESNALGLAVSPVGNWKGSVTGDVTVQGTSRAKFEKWLSADGKGKDFCSISWRKDGVSILMTLDGCDMSLSEMADLADHLVSASEAIEACK